MKSVFGYGGTSIGSGPTINEQHNTNNRANNKINLSTSEQSTAAHVPQVPVNFNINLFHHSQSMNDNVKTIKNNSFLINNRLKTNSKNSVNLIEMLKNKDNDSVDSKYCDSLTVKRRNHRALSF